MKKSIVVLIFVAILLGGIVLSVASVTKPPTQITPNTATAKTTTIPTQSKITTDTSGMTTVRLGRDESYIDGKIISAPPQPPIEPIPEKHQSSIWEQIIIELAKYFRGD